MAVLSRNLELELMNNHTERNLAALTLYYCACGVHAPARIDSLVQRVMGATILDDGTQVERSAMYQGLSVMSLEIFAQAEALSPRTRSTARALAAKATEAWAVLTHSDQDIALFNDSWWGETPRCSEATGVPPAPRGWLPSGGYLKFAGADVTTLMDLGAIGPSWNPGHGHEDALSLEVDVRGRRLLVDPGTSTYDAGAQRQAERAAETHNAPRFIDASTATFTGSFRVVEIPPEPAVSHLDLAGQSVAAELATPAGTVHRSLEVSDHGARVVDRWDGTAPGETSILIPGTWTLTFGSGTILCEQEDVVAEIVLEAGQVVGSQQDTWSSVFGFREAATRIRLAPDDASSPRELAFLIRRGSEVTPM
ncbi:MULTISPECIES: heparinase II/III-family protein [unclassified Aeromicrobium]|uniref:heparinase II/III-family protein n=1 Tax=unclassified Aeromicrobium TaxID=2633570 RepID=UPI00288A5B51|nr:MULTISPECIES: heparinase II/III-family protein [unclassified Aeromicrobium]